MQLRFYIIFFLGLVLAGCASFRPQLEPPQVTVTNVRVLPSDQLAPRFEISLRISNPNAVTLTPRGLVYSISLEGRQLLQGVSNQLPAIEGYATADLSLVAVADLIEGMGLLAELMGKPRDRFEYVLKARLDVGALSPPVRVEKRGTISLAGENLTKP